jgi:hypothetical protein
MAIIDKPSDYFNTKLYTGTGSATSITGVGFQPDLVYTTSRSNGYNNGMFDSVRGVQKELTTNTTNAEATLTTAISSFDSDGFSFSGSAYNTSAYTFVGWNWKAGGTAVSNTDGSITSSVSANTDAGFSIVSYTGTGSASTIGHGLGSAPKMVICKTRSTAGVWLSWHTGIPITGQIQLQSTDAVYNPGTGLYWNSTLPTSSVFSVGTSGSVNGSGTTYIAYCFAEKQGYSKFGSYIGNASTNGTFVYTGFKPAFAMVKRTDSTGSWFMYDAKRNTYNVLNNYLLADTSGAEGTAEVFDFTSQGFKLRYAGGQVNTSGASMIYMAFAENPFVTSTGVPTTAR